jgi:hypothetical protein
MSSGTPSVAEAHERIRAGDTDMPLSNFSIIGTCAGMNLGAQNIYRIAGMFILVYPDAVYFLDHAALDQLCQVSKW